MWASWVLLAGLTACLFAAQVGISANRAWGDPDRRRTGRFLAWVILASGVVIISIGVVGVFHGAD